VSSKRSESGYSGAELADWLADIVAVLQSSGVPFALIGGASVMLYGKRSRTRDVDFLVALEPRRWPILDDRLKHAGLRVESKGLWHHRAWRGQLYADLVLAEVPEQAAAIAEAVVHEMTGVAVPVAPPEYVVALKLIAGRPQDLRDVEEIRECVADLDEKLVARLLAPYENG